MPRFFFDAELIELAKKAYRHRRVLVMPDESCRQEIRLRLAEGLIPGLSDIGDQVLLSRELYDRFSATGLALPEDWVGRTTRVENLLDAFRLETFELSLTSPRFALRSIATLLSVWRIQRRQWRNQRRESKRRSDMHDSG